jgi:mannose-6-phosphate isomerase
LLLLDNPIQSYAWGSRSVLAELQGRPPAAQPEAELWIGAHPQAPSRSSDGRSLLELIRSDPQRMLGQAVAERFGAQLPFLLKVLAVDAPLSLQAHPNLEQARAGFAREQAAGVPLDARERTYKDDNHKPELLCALTRFEALSGFREPAQSAALLEQLGLPASPALTQLLALLRSAEREPLRAAFSGLMTLPVQSGAELAAQVCERAERGAAEPGPFQGSLRWAARLGQAYPGDVGAVASLLLQHLVLEPLQAVYLEAGRLHAYLCGTGVEIMASSDNVLRGGLTPKHIDVPELLNVLRFDAPRVAPTRTRQASAVELIYDTPAAEFALSRVDLDGQQPLAARLAGPELWLCVEGQARLQLPGAAALPSGKRRDTAAEHRDTAEHRGTAEHRDTAEPHVRQLRRGQACFLPASVGAVRVSGSARLFRAGVGSSVADPPT